MSQSQLHIRSYTIQVEVVGGAVTIELPRTFPRKGVIKQVIVEGPAGSIEIKLTRDTTPGTFYLHPTFEVPGVDSNVNGPFDFSGQATELEVDGPAGTYNIRFDIEVR